ncbi:unnamed protein product, partial [Ranitomeya imitator]
MMEREKYGKGVVQLMIQSIPPSVKHGSFSTPRSPVISPSSTAASRLAGQDDDVFVPSAERTQQRSGPVVLAEEPRSTAIEKLELVRKWSLNTYKGWSPIFITVMSGNCDCSVQGEAAAPGKQGLHAPGAVTLRSEGAVTWLVHALCLNIRAEDAEDGAAPERSQVNNESAGGLSNGQCTRQILSEKLGRGSRTVDLELESQIEILRDNKKKYEHILKLAQTLSSQLYQMVQTQRHLGDAFADLSLKSLELHIGYISVIKTHFGTNRPADSAGALHMRPPFWKMAAPRKEDGRIPG